MSLVNKDVKYQLKERSATISDDRKKALNKLVLAIKAQIADTEQSVVKFICTHNSRRSQLAEFMLDLLARENGLPIIALSAGTEATAFNPRMVKALESFGFELIKYGSPPNQLYIYRINLDDLYYFSKRYDEEIINYGEPIIVTVCGDAEENCPIIPGTYQRMHLGYKDPKAFDGTAQEAEAYRQKVLEIGSEMYYVIEQFSSPHK